MTDEAAAPGLGGRRRARGGPQAALVKRLWRALARQAQEVERRLAEDDRTPADDERDACLIGTLAKAAKELATLDREVGADAEAGRDGRDDWRAELVRRIDRLREIELSSRGDRPA